MTFHTFHAWCQQENYGFNTGMYRDRESGNWMYAVIIQDMNYPDHFVQANEATLEDALAQAAERMRELKAGAIDLPQTMPDDTAPPVD